MSTLKYLLSYPDDVQAQVEQLLQQNKLRSFLLKRYPEPHNIANDKSLRDYAFELKNRYLKSSSPLSKVIYDGKLHVIHNALGTHSFVSRVQGNKLKSKNEIRVSSVFKKAPEAFLNMIVVHELAHIREKEHNKAFYQLCQHMQPDYHQLEFEMRVYLTQLETYGSIYD
jgi:predicted metal-dependent hydrolase